MPTKTTPYDVADYLTSVDRVAAYLELAMEEGDPKTIAKARDNVAERAAIPVALAILARAGVGKTPVQGDELLK
jgi:DNA-binding phage protein